MIKFDVAIQAYSEFRMRQAALDGNSVTDDKSRASADDKSRASADGSSISSARS